MKLAVIFNGQGAHFQEMGLDFIKTYSKAQQVMDEVSEISGYPIQDWIQNQPEKFKATAYAQPAIVGVSLAIYEVVKEMLPTISYMAGLSLGEYSALIASGYLDRQRGFELLTQRGEIMSQHCQKLEAAFPTQMLAVLNMPLNEVAALVKELKKDYPHLYISNHNSAKQVIVSGNDEALSTFQDQAKEKGFKKMMPLKVEGPFHTPLMEGAQEAFSHELAAYQFKEGEVPVLSNTTLQAHKVSSVKEVLVRHLVEPVQWKETIDHFEAAGITHIVQIGPGSTLANLMKKEKRPMQYMVVNQIEDIELLKTFFKEDYHA